MSEVDKQRARIPLEIGRYQHVKTGSTYELIVSATLQISKLTPAMQESTHALIAERVIGQLDTLEMVVYQAEHDLSIWVRPREEFFDGRFVKL